jgi:hypothetical protein
MCSVEDLQKNLPFNNALLSNLKCLQPDFRGTVESETAFRNLAQAVPHVSGAEFSLVTDEWKLYALNDINSGSNLPAHHVDQYWATVLAIEMHLASSSTPIWAKLSRPVPRWHMATVMLKEASLLISEQYQQTILFQST